MIELKVLKPEAVSTALEKAKQYRLLNEPEEAESICLDILASVPDQQEAKILLLLALTDKFAHGEINPAYEKAKKVLTSLDNSHCKSYYQGIIFERRGKHYIKRGGPGVGSIAYEWLVKAMEAYSEAILECAAEAQKAVLRWNSCARVINGNPEVKADEGKESEMFLDSFDTPH